jgi:ABC-type transport system substrate-binding protein
VRDSLVIEDAFWPVGDLNQLTALSEIPWPNWLTYTVYQPLVTLNQTAEFQTGAVQYLPGLATGWTVSPDSRTYTFNLRNVSFSSGNRFNAYQVWLEMYGFYYLSANSSTWLESYALFNMSNVKFGPSTTAFISANGGVTHPNQAAQRVMMDNSWPIYVTNDHQIVFRLQSPFLYFPGTLVVFEGMMFDVQYVLDHGGFGTPAAINSQFNQKPIPGSGPYLVTQVSENNYVKFAQDPNYWGKNATQAELQQQPVFDPGHAKNVIVYAKSDDIARYTDLANGQSQISAVFASDWNLVQANSAKFAYLTAPSWSAIFGAIALNTHVYPTNITAVRQAIVHAINYSDVYKQVFNQVTPMVGPEYPAWKDYYDLGNFPPYQYNLTLAQNYMAQANLKDSPTITFRLLAGCDYCLNIAQVVQADLAQIGLTVDLVVLTPSAMWGPFGSYTTNVKNAEEIGQMSLVGGIISWAPATATPADYWVTFVNNASSWGNQAGYSSPQVQPCVNAFTASSNVTYIQSLCKVAQKQIYDDAPYAWLGTMKLWYGGGSLVWDKSVVKSFLLDPVWSGQTPAPIFNTVTFVS